MKEGMNEARRCAVFVKTILFNLFLFGLVVNLITLTSSSWIAGENYIIGIFKFCKAIPNEDRLHVFYSIKCFGWNKLNRPNFLEFSLRLQLTAVILHCMTILCILLTTIIFNKQKKSKLNNALHCLQNVSKQTRFEIISFKIGFFHENALVYIIGSGMGFLVSSLYASNLLIFGVNNVLSRTRGKHEHFSWCFWISLVGLCATLFSTSTLFVHTIRNKILKINKTNEYLDETLRIASPSFSNGFQQATKYDQAFTLTRKTSINPLLLNEQTRGKRPSIESQSFRKKLRKKFRMKRLWKKNILNFLASRTTVKITGDNNIESDCMKVVSHESISFNLDGAIINPAQMYSQVYPVNKNKKNPKHTKMTALPFKSLSGVLTRGSFTVT